VRPRPGPIGAYRMRRAEAIVPQMDVCGVLGFHPLAWAQPTEEGEGTEPLDPPCAGPTKRVNRTRYR
jgi:hypothetical protein